MNSRGIAWVIVILFFIFWEIFVQISELPVYILPAPSRIFVTLFENLPDYLNAGLITLIEAAGGLLIGLTAGILIASIISFFPLIESGVMTLAILVKSTPLVAVAPLLTIWLGFGILPKILITALLTFFPVLVNMLSGLGQVDRAYLDLFHVWHVSRRETFIRLRLPSSLPYLFAALKIAAPLSLIGAVVAEWTGASGGLGRTMWLAYSNLNLPFLFAAIFLLSLLGMIVYQLLDRFERKSLFWIFPDQNARD